MTDKEIIIGGVDVSECNFTLERDGKIKCECTHATGLRVVCDCESWKTCDYKNYKRKEQECLELEHELNNYKQALNEIENIADDYNRVEKTSQYYRDGFDEIQNIINKGKEQKC